MIDLPFIWAGLIAFAVLAYVLFDGFDLGIGILFPFLADDHERDVAMNSVAPVWDGNETWLVLGGGGLMAAFPLAYAVVMPALYVPITLMLLGLVFRGVAFEFRWRTVRGSPCGTGRSRAARRSPHYHKASRSAPWCRASRSPTAPMPGAGGTGSPGSACSPGAALVVGYALLGATWLILKTTDELQASARRFAWITGAGDAGAHRPRQPDHAVPRSCLHAALVRLAGGDLLRPRADLRGPRRARPVLGALARERDAMPFLAAIALFVLSFIGIGISFYPYILPPSITIWHAAAPDNSLSFLLVGAVC